MKQLFFLLIVITSLTSCNSKLQKDKNFKQLDANQTGITFSNNLTETKELTEKVEKKVVAKIKDEVKEKEEDEECFEELFENTQQYEDGMDSEDWDGIWKITLDEYSGLHLLIDLLES